MAGSLRNDGGQWGFPHRISAEVRCIITAAQLTTYQCKEAQEN